jgi:predicted nucleic acid-binding protein
MKSKGYLTNDENDIYIAAFCKAYGLTLVTSNTKHFDNIDGLVLEDWTIAEEDAAHPATGKS